MEPGDQGADCGDAGNLGDAGSTDDSEMDIEPGDSGTGIELVDHKAGTVATAGNVDRPGDSEKETSGETGTKDLKRTAGNPDDVAVLFSSYDPNL